MQLSKTYMMLRQTLVCAAFVRSVDWLAVSILLSVSRAFVRFLKSAICLHIARPQLCDSDCGT